MQPGLFHNAAAIGKIAVCFVSRAWLRLKKLTKYLILNILSHDTTMLELF
jgi:hypothetical protein